MSDVNTAAAPPTKEPSTTTDAPVLSEQVPSVTEPAAASAEAATKTESAAPTAATAATETPASTTAPAEEKKAADPISEGLLAYKGPGLVKSLIPSKKYFWLSDAKLAPQDLHSYLRGEKPEVAHGVVAWASQTGKGLLFFNKKDDTDKTKPQSVLPLYEATELKKASPHEITFEIHGHKHTLKAVNDAERDGWYMSLERAVEVGKAEKETTRSSQGYKEEMEKLAKPNTLGAGAAGAAAGAGVAGAAAGKKSVEEPKRTDSDELAPGKQKKSRSTSRGILGRFQQKKEEAEAKKEAKEEAKEEKKAEKEEAKEEKKAEKDAEKHADKAVEAAPAVVGGSTLDAHGTADRVLGAPVSGETATETIPTTKAEETKPSKRGSIFGRLGSNFSGLRSPAKEKDAKEVELKPEVPAKDNVVSETAPQLPEPSTETAIEPPVVAAGDGAEPKSDSKPAEAAKEPLDAVSPSKESKSFLSGFTNKLRNRSVSPSANMKEAPVAKKEETTAVAEPETKATEPVAAAATESNPVEPSVAAEPAAEKATEPAAGAPNKRESVFQGIGRRASKAFKSFSGPQKKDNEASATTETKKEATNEAEAAAPASESSKPLVNGEGKSETIGDVVPEAVLTGQPQSNPTVTASA